MSIYPIRMIILPKQSVSRALRILITAFAFNILSGFHSLADEFRHGPHEHPFREHDVHRFRPHELELWRGGVWRHEWHEGRLGWWWAVGGAWYFYERPIYPYPMVVANVVYVPPVTVVAPTYSGPQMPPVSPQGTTVVAPLSPPGVPAPGVPAPEAQLYFYCDSAKAYYPAVMQCPQPWRRVPLMPPQSGSR